MSVEITRCPHRESDVVIPHGWDVIAARICTDCSERLPANWGCQECEWEEVREFSGKRWVISAALCDDHRNLEGLI